MSALSGAPDLDRVVEIEHALPGGDRGRGTGYLVAPGVVLTVQHVVQSARRSPAHIRTRRASSTLEEDWVQVREVVLAGDPRLDVALLLLESYWSVGGTPTPGQVDIGAPIPFHACGFPAVHRDGDARDTETARGLLRPDTMARSKAAILVLDVTSAVPATRELTSIAQGTRPRSGWAGLSGAAVFGPGGLLVGVVTESDVDFVADRLHAAPITSVLADDALATHLPESWRHADTPRLSNQLTIGVGSRHRVRLRSPRRGRSGETAHGGRPPRPIVLLTAKAETVPFIAREKPQQRLRDWCDAEAPVDYLVLSGEGGAGKSRLAAELCATMRREGWAAGLVEPEDGAAADLGVEEIGRPTLLVVDYADHLQGYVADLLRGAATRGSHKVRILTVVRDGEAFLRRFALELDADAESLGPDHEIALGRSPLADEERVAHYRAACTAFSGVLGSPVPSTAPNTEPEPDEEELRLRLASMPLPLLVHARAMLDVLDRPGPQSPGGSPLPAVPDPGPIEAAEVLRELLEREDEKYWKPLFDGLLSTRRARRAVFAVSTLVGAETEAEARSALGAVDTAEMRSDTTRRRVVERMQDLYGDDRLLPLVEPDLLGEQLIADTLLAGGSVGAVLDRVVSAGQLSRGLEVLLRMCGSPVGTLGATALAALVELVDTRLDRLVGQAIAVTVPDDPTVGHDARQLPSRLASCVELAATGSAAARVAAAVEFPPRVSLQRLAAAVYRIAADHAAAAEDDALAASLAARATTALAALGQYDAAQATLQQAMTYLGTTPTFASSPELARVLSAGSAVSLGTGRPAVAVQDATRAVQIVERLAGEDPGRHSAQLVEARLGLVLAFMAAGRRPEAERTARDSLADPSGLDLSARLRLRAFLMYLLELRGDFGGAVELIRAGIDEIHAEHDPAEHLPEMCGLLVAQAVIQASLGRLVEGRASAEDAERTAEEFALGGREEGALLLAQVRLGAASVAAADQDRAEAAELAQLARDALFRLYRDAEDLYGHFYIVSEALLSRTLCDAGQFEEARQAARRGSNAARTGFVTRPALFLPGLVESALALANIHAVADDFDGATAVVEDALGRVSRLDASLSARAQEFRALLLRVLADIEAARGEPGEGVSAARRAVDAYSALAGGRGEIGFLVHLVGSRLLLVKALNEADRLDEAVDQAQQVLADAERLIAEAPNDLSRRILALARYNVAMGYGEQDRPEAGAELLRLTLEEFVLDQETGGDAEDRELIREAIRELESPAPSDRGGSAPPATFADLSPGPHRVVLGRFRGEEVAARDFRPVLVLGPQRSRKTTSLIVPTLLEWDGPVLVTSVRADVVMGSIRRRSRMGDVSVFEPMKSLFSGGSALASWNPLDGCEVWETAVGTAFALTESMRAGGDSRDVYWYQQACLLLQSLLHAAALSLLSMDAVSHWVRTATRAEVIARLRAGGAREALDLFQSFSEMVDATRDGVYATARNVLRAYESEAVRRSSLPGFNPRDFFNGAANTLYLCAPPEDQERLAPVFTALVRSVIMQAYRWQGDPLDLLLLLDEAGNIARIDNLDTVATTAAGTRIQLVTAFHDVSQMAAVYGHDRAESIVNNHSALLILPGSRDAATMNLAERIFMDERGSGIRRRSVRQLKPGTALCVYEHLPMEEIVLRSSTHDAALVALARDGGPDDDVSDLVVPSRRN